MEQINLVTSYAMLQNLLHSLIVLHTCFRTHTHYSGIPAIGYSANAFFGDP